MRTRKDEDGRAAGQGRAAVTTRQRGAEELEAARRREEARKGEDGVFEREAAAKAQAEGGAIQGERNRGFRGPLLPGPLLTHLHTVYMAYSECLRTRWNPLAERTGYPRCDSCLLCIKEGSDSGATARVGPGPARARTAGPCLASQVHGRARRANGVRSGRDGRKRPQTPKTAPRI
jgi:hypothetical protein